MARLACVSVPALPLQLLLRTHPDWRGLPAAVVADERVQSRLLWVNSQAWRQGVRTGMRHAAALSLSHGLRAGTVPAQTVAAEVRALTRGLQRHSPHVEPAREEPGVFWLDAAGLERLHPGLRSWAHGVAEEVAAAGLRAVVAVGHDRFAAYAATRTLRTLRTEGSLCLFADADAERRAVRGVPLGRLGIDPDARDTLARLGVHTLAELLRLPPLGLLQRFGAPLYRLHRLAAGTLAESLQPAPEHLPAQEALALEDAEHDLARLLFGLKGRLQALLGTLGARQQALSALHLRLLLEGARPLETVLKPAAPTRDPALLLDLVRLRLEQLSQPALEAGVSGIELLAEGEPRELIQLPLFSVPEAQGLEAANRALARLRAEFGEQAVVRARLTSGHLPEASFVWEPLQALPAQGSATAGGATAGSAKTGSAKTGSAKATSTATSLSFQVRGGAAPSGSPAIAPRRDLTPFGAGQSRRGGIGPGRREAEPSSSANPKVKPWLSTRAAKAAKRAEVGAADAIAQRSEPPELPASPVLVRRLYAVPQPLQLEPAGAQPLRALARALGSGPLARLHGPYPLSGGWWAGAQHRDYYFAETRRGDLLWLYHDRLRKQWCLQGRVE